MAIAFGPIIAGPYSGAYNTVDVGFTLEGFKYAQEYSGEELDQSDIFGKTLFDIVYLGGKSRISFISRTFKAGSMTPFWPWGAFGVLATIAAPISRLASAIAKTFVLSSVANTPAAASPASVTANLAILPPNTTGELLYDAKARNVPIVLQLLPYETGGDGTLKVLTTT